MAERGPPVAFWPRRAVRDSGPPAKRTGGSATGLASIREKTAARLRLAGPPVRSAATRTRRAHRRRPGQGGPTRPPVHDRRDGACRRRPANSARGSGGGSIGSTAGGGSLGVGGALVDLAPVTIDRNELPCRIRRRRRHGRRRDPRSTRCARLARPCQTTLRR